MINVIDGLLQWLKIDNSEFLIPSCNLKNSYKLILFELTDNNIDWKYLKCVYFQPDQSPGLLIQNF